jgi:tetrapyrrole methylase family protein / MazG family protein
VARRPHVTVVGLGPAGPDFVGDNAAALLKGPPGRIFLRTARHPAAADFPGLSSFDLLYETAGTFDEVYGAIVDALVAAARDAAPEPVVYAVPGSPLVAERTVDLLRADDRVEVTALPALSFLDLAWVALGIDPLAEGVRLVDASDFGPALAQQGGPFLVAQCWSRHLLSEVKLALSDDAGAELPRPVLLHHLGLEDELVQTVDWWELDRTLEPDHLTSLYIPAFVPATTHSAGSEVAALVDLMATLRERCPWDSVQTHASLMPHLVEESYEVLDALAELPGGDAAGEGITGQPAAFAHLQEELGDLLFQIVFHSRLADEEGQFDLADVARGVHDKLVHRHPHVFGDVDAHTAEQVVTNWEAIKKSEKGRRSVTEGIPSGLPALMLTAKLARKARAVGVEPDVMPEARVASALAALSAQAEETDPQADDPFAAHGGDTQVAVGELLYAVANLAQRLGVDAEQALRGRALSLRADILAAEGVPEAEVGNR